LRVLKFGGKSLHSVEAIDKLARKVSEFKDERFIIVVSAMGDATSNLLRMAELAGPKAPSLESQRELDMLLGSGERVSAALFSLALQKYGRRSQSFTGSQAGILTTGPHSNASISEIKPIRIDQCLDEKIIPVVAGFQGVDPETKNITTLGRGGSDLTALFFAKHYSCAAELYKSVGGLFTADPTIVDNARPIRTIAPDHLENICYWGTKALYTKAAKLALEFRVPLTFHDDDSFEMMTKVEASKEESFCITSLNNIAAVMCTNKSIGQGLETLEKHFYASPFRVLASAQDAGDSRFLLDFIDTKPSNLEFSEQVKALNLNMRAVSVISSQDLNDSYRRQILKATKESHVLRLLESKNRMSFFIESEVLDRFINKIHQAIFEPSQDKN
jgi:aspartate kinase